MEVYQKSNQKIRKKSEKFIEMVLIFDDDDNKSYKKMCIQIKIKM